MSTKQSWEGDPLAMRLIVEVVTRLIYLAGFFRAHGNDRGT